NPLLKVVDIAAVAATIGRRAEEGGRRPLIVVDNTFASPALQRPLELGADIVFHSATKYLAGHSDTVTGVIVTNDPEAAERLRFLQNAMGAVPGPQDCFLALRGLRTLHLRVRAACQSAQAIAEHLSQHPLVAEVLYPGLPTFQGHAIAKAQMSGGFGGMLSIRVRAGVNAGGNARMNVGVQAGGEAAAIAVAARTTLWKRATSLGGTESLIEHRASVEGTGTPAPADLLRLSVGIEHVGDLIADLEQALQRAHD
ncbi:MAG: PLP-dependent transferase, partial [Chitinophagaceae bacterium]|nr:PLP-dependent transferase [Rubrivivax sp.]